MGKGAASPAAPHLKGSTRLAALLKPLVRAYVFGHLSSTAPRLLSALLKLRSKSLTHEQAINRIKHVISTSASFDKFPAFCALITGSYTFLQIPLAYILEHVKTLSLKQRFNLGPHGPSRWSRYIAAFLAAFLALPLLNRRPRSDRNSSNPSTDHAVEIGAFAAERPPHPDRELDLAGKTMDLTLLATVRALETLAHSAWTTLCRTNGPAFSPRTQRFMSTLIDPLIFASSTGIVMWAWFYSPERLPRSYNRWISSAAAVDPRLITALRLARRGEWVYGMDTGNGHVLASMSRDYGMPQEWGDPAKSIPVPCDIIHMGTGPNCHWHAVVRFVRAFRFALAMYLPLQLSMKVASRRKPLSISVLRATIRESVRSSAFLGAFIALFYYGVCAGRTWLGPRIFSSNTVSPIMWDGGFATGAGCFACGWSVLLERPTRRQELAMFVAPRAAATVLPRKYERKYFWRERLAFATSITVLFPLAQENPMNIRGVMGALLHGVLSVPSSQN